MWVLCFVECIFVFTAVSWQVCKSSTACIPADNSLRLCAQSLLYVSVCF